MFFTQVCGQVMEYNKQPLMQLEMSDHVNSAGGREQGSDLQHAGLSLSEADFQAVVGSWIRSYIVECSGERKHRNTFSQVDQQENCLSGKNMMRLHLMTFIQLKDLVQIVNKFNSNLLF